MDYLINKYKNDVFLKTKECECCGKTYETNINRTRCSRKCANKMKNERKKVNRLTKVKYKKETMNHIKKDVFGFVSSSVY